MGEQRIAKILLRIAVYIIVFVDAFSLTVSLVSRHYQKASERPVIVDFNEDDGSKETDLSYGDAEPQKYDLYLPAEAKKEGNGLIVFLHGGTFVNGDKSDMTHWAETYCRQGYITASLNYRLMSSEEGIGVDQMKEDVADGIRAVLQDCKEKGYAVDEMALMGRSAGGTLALLYGYGEDTAVPVRFIAVQSALGQFEPAAFGADPEDADSLKAFADGMSGDSSDTDAQQKLDAISPCTQIRKEIPVLYAYGDYDHTFPGSINETFLKALEQSGAVHTVIEFENSPHDLILDPDKAEEFRKTMDTFCDTYLPL